MATNKVKQALLRAAYPYCNGYRRINWELSFHTLPTDPGSRSKWIPAIRWDHEPFWNLSVHDCWVVKLSSFFLCSYEKHFLVFVRQHFDRHLNAFKSLINNVKKSVDLSKRRSKSMNDSVCLVLAHVLWFLYLLVNFRPLVWPYILIQLISVFKIYRVN